MYTKAVSKLRMINLPLTLSINPYLHHDDNANRIVSCQMTLTRTKLSHGERGHVPNSFLSIKVSSFLHMVEAKAIRTHVTKFFCVDKLVWSKERGKLKKKKTSLNFYQNESHTYTNFRLSGLLLGLSEIIQTSIRMSHTRTQISGYQDYS